MATTKRTARKTARTVRKTGGGGAGDGRWRALPARHLHSQLLAD